MQRGLQPKRRRRPGPPQGRGASTPLRAGRYPRAGFGPGAAAIPPSAGERSLLPQLLRQLVQVEDLQELVEVQLALPIRVHRAECPGHFLRADARGQDQNQLLQLITRQGHRVVRVSVDRTFRESVLKARVQIHDYFQRLVVGRRQLVERHFLVQLAHDADLVIVDPRDKLVELDLAAAVSIDPLEPRLELGYAEVWLDLHGQLHHRILFDECRVVWVVVHQELVGIVGVWPQVALEELVEPLYPLEGHARVLAQLLEARLRVLDGGRRHPHVVHRQMLHLALRLCALLQLVGHPQLQRHEARGRHQHLLEDLALYYPVCQLRVVDLLQDGPRVGLVGRPPPLLAVAGDLPGLQQAKELHQLLQ
mmetsp:Transcript_91921/g.239623  ORF Transcript_91921/g.239623 Transcript_91921/m.239623 type:complete len:364 (-) Transcript_91921:1181-2272(-)